MYYSYEDEVQVVFQIRIQELKLKIKGLLNKYFTMLGYYGILTEEDFMVYNKVIGKLNESFYGYNVKDMTNYIKSLGYKVPKGYLISTLTTTELHYYKSMLSKLYQGLLKIDGYDLSKFIALAEHIGERAKIYFVNNHGMEPIEFLKIDLEKRRIKELKSDKSNEIKELKEKNRILREKLQEVKSQNRKLDLDNKNLIRERKGYINGK